MSGCSRHKVKYLGLTIIPFGYLDIFCEKCHKEIVTRSKLVLLDIIFFIVFLCVVFFIFYNKPNMAALYSAWFGISYPIFRLLMYLRISLKLNKSKKV